MTNESYCYYLGPGRRALITRRPRPGVLPRGPPPPVPKLKPAFGVVDGCCVGCCPNPLLPNPPVAGFCGWGADPPKGIGAAPAVGWAEPKVVAVLLNVFPKGCAGAAGAEPKGMGAAAGVEEPNCIGALDPNGAEVAVPNPELDPGAGVEPKVIAAVGAVVVEPNVGAFGAGAGAEPNVNGADWLGAGAGAGVDPNVKGTDGLGAGAGAGVDPNVNEGTVGVGAGAGVGVDPKVKAGADGVEATAGAGAAPNATPGAGVEPKLGADAGVPEAD